MRQNRSEDGIISGPGSEDGDEQRMFAENMLETAKLKYIWSTGIYRIVIILSSIFHIIVIITSLFKYPRSKLLSIAGWQ